MQQAKPESSNAPPLDGQHGEPMTSEKCKCGRHVTGAAPGSDTAAAGGGPLSSFCNNRGKARAAPPRAIKVSSERFKCDPIAGPPRPDEQKAAPPRRAR